MKSKFENKVTVIVLCLTLILANCPVMAKGNPTSGKWRKNVTWSYDKKTATLTVSGTGYMDRAGNDDGDNPGWEWWSKKAKKIIITGNLKDISVCAFSDFEKVKTVEMCDSIIKIESSAFDGCESLKKVNLSKNLKKIGESAFASTDIKQIRLPESVKEIGAFAFEGCEKLKKINLPSGIKKINRDTFWYCKKLKNITLPPNLTEIGKYTFEATGITNITIPSKVKVIGEGVFYNCRNLKKVNIKSKELSDIGADAFVDVPAKTKITVPKSKEGFYRELLGKSGTNGKIKVNGKKLFSKKSSKIGKVSFEYTQDDEEKSTVTISGTGEIKDFSDYEEKEDYCYKRDLTSVDRVIIKEGITRIGAHAFRNSKGLKSVTLPSTLTSIGDYAFYDCEDLKKIQLPDGLKSIGKGAFAYSGIKKVKLPKKTDSVGKYAFAGCRSLKEVELSSSLKKISWGTFWKCKKLTKIQLPAGLRKIEDYAFYGSGIPKSKVPDQVKADK